MSEDKKDEALLLAAIICQQDTVQANSLINEAESHITKLKEIIRQGQKINAIKLYRDITNVGLKEAKDYIDSFEYSFGGFQRQPTFNDYDKEAHRSSDEHSPEIKSGFNYKSAFWVLLLIVLAIAAFFAYSKFR